MHVLRVPSSYSNFWWATSTLDLGTLTYFYMAGRRKSSFYSGAISQKGAEKWPCPPLSLHLLQTPTQLTKTKMLEKDQPVRDGVWTSAEIELINEKALPPFPFLLIVF